MAEPTVESPDLKLEVGSPGQKRKRGSIDQDSGDHRAKRGAPAPAANMMPSTDTSGLSFLEAAAAEGGVGVDLSALQQANEAANHSVDTSSHHPVLADVANASSTAAAALGSMYPTLHVPSTTEQQFVQAAAAAEVSNAQDGGFGDVGHVDVAESPSGSISSGAGPVLAPNGTQGPHEESPQHQGPQQGQHPHHPQAQAVQQTQQQAQQQRTDYQFHKPPVGSDEWHKLRKNNHKEVERRRRETINEGINELAKIVPGCEKNKGSILQKAVQFIQTLKANETSNIEKWTLEKLLTEQAIGELSVSNEKLKAECARLYEQIDVYKRTIQEHGIDDPAGKADATVETSTPNA
ncbi:related to CBF1 - centromere binding factor 1 [Cephalotrichum gorgonifer]|uniref:Related to CBF1 - centromere binding factor 1 n=1 Tax=Cephalotrichum gorgonifer TaxID=2041049 RepID=A0AAE8MR37_9PEZI|nr:related to CBF1 - centromere binding factor 1 [Cephalotrichum gorgonifer]